MFVYQDGESGALQCDGDADDDDIIIKTIKIHTLGADKQRNNSRATSLTRPAVRPCEGTCYRRHVLPMSAATFEHS